MQGALEELPGILEARVDPKTKDVYVKYRPAQATQEAMRQAVERVDLRLRARHWFHRWMLWLRRGSDHGA